MTGRTYSKIALPITLSIAVVVFLVGRLKTPIASVNFAKMARIGTVDERFQSYNIEMIEVTGGRFWKPYSSFPRNDSKSQDATKNARSGSTEIDPDLYQYRPPIDLSNPRLRKLAAALGPAYVRSVAHGPILSIFKIPIFQLQPVLHPGSPES